MTGAKVRKILQTAEEPPDYSTVGTRTAHAGGICMGTGTPAEAAGQGHALPPSSLLQKSIGGLVCNPLPDSRPIKKKPLGRTFIPTACVLCRIF